MQPLQYSWFMWSTKAVQGVEFLFEALMGMCFKNYAPPYWMVKPAGSQKAIGISHVHTGFYAEKIFGRCIALPKAPAGPIHLCAELRKHTHAEQVHSPSDCLDSLKLHWQLRNETSQKVAYLSFKKAFYLL